MNKSRKIANETKNTLIAERNARCAKKAIFTAVTALCIASIAAVGASALPIGVTASIQSEGTKVLKNVIKLVGGGIGAWGVVSLIEGYGNDNPGAKSQGVKQLVAGVALIAATGIVDAIFAN